MKRNGAGVLLLTSVLAGCTASAAAELSAPDSPTGEPPASAPALVIRIRSHDAVATVRLVVPEEEAAEGRFEDRRTGRVGDRDACQGVLNSSCGLSFM